MRVWLLNEGTLHHALNGRGKTGQDCESRNHGMNTHIKQVDCAPLPWLPRDSNCHILSHTPLPHNALHRSPDCPLHSHLHSSTNLPENSRCTLVLCLVLAACTTCESPHPATVPSAGPPHPVHSRESLPLRDPLTFTRQKRGFRCGRSSLETRVSKKEFNNEARTS